MRRNASRAGLGASSVMLIMVVLCLVSFAALTWISARVDERLTGRAIESARLYYEADGRAQQWIAACDAALAQGRDPAMLGLEAVERTEDGWLVRAPLNDGRTIEARLADAGGACRIVSYRLIHESEWEAEEPWNLW